MKINQFVDKIFCINLKHRSDKREFIKKQCSKNKLDITFFKAIENKKGWIGCLQSHLNILKIAKKERLKKILIIEDDCLFLTEPSINQKELPQDWEMLFLGGNMTKLLEDDHFDARNKKWVKMCCLTTHSYIIKSSIYDYLIKELQKCQEPIDVFYANKFHLKKTSYMINPQITTQKDGYSDIEGKMLSYSLRTLEDVIEILDAPHNYNEETMEYILKSKNYSDEELPFVSILTPTKNRRKFFKMAVHCFLNYDYPHEKLEWIIVDDSDDGTTLRDILPKDKRIKYIRKKTKRKIPVSEKRNICMKYASHDFLVNMDDDDYYMPHSIKTRVKVLMTYPNINMVGCGMVCCYDVDIKKFYIVGDKTTLSEASMCFRKKFWEELPFNEKVKFGEGKLFLRERKEQCYRIPYTFVLFVMNHKNNITSSLRRVKDEKQYIDYFELPKDIMNIIENI